MLTILIAGLAGAVGGGVVAGLLAWWLLRQRHGDRAVGPFIDADLDMQINRAAAWWAKTHNRPMSAPLVARKLRLTYGLNQRRRNRRKRWSR